MQARRAGDHQQRARQVRALEEVGAPEIGGAKWAAAHHCGRIEVVSEASVTASRVGCGQAWEMQTHVRKKAMEVPSIVETLDATSCAADGRLRRASVILTWAAR